jgi:two-component system, cell cycle response regulator
MGRALRSGIATRGRYEQGMDVNQAKRPLLIGLTSLGVVCLLYTVGAATGFWKEHLTVGNWTYIALLFGAALLCLTRGTLIRAHRGAWVAIGVGLLFNGFGDLCWVLFFQGAESVPYPSPADALWLAGYPPMGLGLWLLLARRGKPIDSGKSVWVDGLAAALAGIALAAATLLAAPLQAAIQGNFLVFATNLSYPLADLFLLGLVLVLCGRAAWRPGVIGGVLAGSLLIKALVDFVYLDQVTRGTYVENGVLDACWPIASLIAATASCLFVSEKRRLGDWRIYVGLFASMSIALSLLVYDHFDRISTVALLLATTALLFGVVRAVLAVRTALSTSRQEAITDPLTGLHNRRALMRDLEDSFAEATPEQHVILASFDLNGFKRYNDTFGHPAGDALLARLGERLRAAVAGAGTAYRVGGDEFCILLRHGDDHLVRAASTALSEVGEGFTVTTAYGAIVVPDEADEVESAIKLVDERLYGNKLARDAGSDTIEALLRTLRESEPEIETHLGNVGTLAREVARELRLSGEEVDVITRAAQLHDIGKLAIPDAILHKPAPLNKAEWGFMRSHVVIGERILSSAPPLVPVARIVRSSHERWEGGGYPDGVAGEEIPLGARIIFACDAYDAMTGTREYRPATSPQEAVAELQRCSGTQFEPAVVDALLRVLKRGGHHSPAKEAPQPAAAG